MQKIKFEGREVECYGELADNSNFDVKCDDELDDIMWCLGNPISEQPFTDWETVVRVLQPYYDSDILEISAV